MKYLVIFASLLIPLLILALSQNANALLVGKTDEQLIKEHDVILIGNITKAEGRFSERITDYTISVEKFLKNDIGEQLQLSASGKKGSNLWIEDETIFEVGDRVLLYLVKNGNSYQISPYSHILDKGEIVLKPSPSGDKILSPLKQFKSGIQADEITCKEPLILVTKYDDSPACVKYETGLRLIQQKWGICSIDLNYDRDHPCGPHSSPAQSLDSTHSEFENNNSQSKSIITINDRIPERTTVPITVTQMTTNAESLDTITNWNFSLLGIEMATLGHYWGNLPDPYVEHGIVDQNGNDVMDYTRVPEDKIFYKLSLWYYPAICEDGQHIKGEGGHPEPIPIKKRTSAVFFKNRDVGLYPDDDGNYRLEFVSGFETIVESHPNITIISQETKKCNLEIQRGNFTEVYYTKTVFRLE